MSEDEAVLLTAATLLAHTLGTEREATAREVEQAVTLALCNGEKLLKELNKQRDEQARKALDGGYLVQGAKQHTEQTKKA